MQISKNITHRQYLFSDFDKDRVKNIDDPFPFDPARKKWPDAEKDPSYYHKARYGGFDTKFSTVLLNIEHFSNQRSPGMKKVLRDNPGSAGRIKTVPSTINKLASRGLVDIRDIAGVSIPTVDREQAYYESKRIKTRYKTNSMRFDDFYKKPKNKAYYALHHEVLNPLPVEVQIASGPMRNLAKHTHNAYKYHKDMTKYISKGRNLFKLGF
jgi:(p)ppGpp synthase/HD superfamily hydrolase